ncbi:MAG: hypothetical protein FGM14_15950 [Flavobacteriales bacterium]|nr:hypothetical protein [Flavobacteriales bacterium]
MKLLTSLSICILLFSCTKDKVADTIIDPNCSDTVSYSTEVWPIIEQYCTGCHDVGNSTGYTLTNHTNVSSNAAAIVGSMKGSGFQFMPQGGEALPDSVIQKIQCWISQGKKNN